MTAGILYRFKNPTITSKWEDVLPPVLLVVALMIRILHVFMGKALDQEIWSDMNGYVDIANQILQGRWHPFHFFQSIGYPMFIAFLKSSTADWGLSLSLIQAAMSFGSLYLMYRMAREWFGVKIGLCVLALGTVHLPWILALGYALPETSFTFFLTICGYFSLKLVKSDQYPLLYSLGWILSFILAQWMKGTHIFLGPLFVLGLLVLKRGRAIVPVMLISGVMLLGIAGHGILTYKTIGKTQFSASAGGLNFVEGKCPWKVNSDHLGYSWQSPLFYQLHLDTSKRWKVPFWESSYFMKEGMKCIQKNPAVLVLSLEGIPYLFYGNNLWPFNQKPYADYVRFYELLLTIFFVVGLVSYARGFFSHSINLSEAIVWCFPILALFMCVYIFKSEIRYRFPFDVWIIPVCMVGWASFLNATGPRWGRGTQ